MNSQTHWLTLTYAIDYAKLEAKHTIATLAVVHVVSKGQDDLSTNLRRGHAENIDKTIFRRIGRVPTPTRTSRTFFSLLLVMTDSEAANNASDSYRAHQHLVCM
jgi:hypothetical protein